MQFDSADWKPQQQKTRGTESLVLSCTVRNLCALLKAQRRWGQMCTQDLAVRNRHNQINLKENISQEPSQVSTAKEQNGKLSTLVSSNY